MTLRCSTSSWSYGDSLVVLVMLWKAWTDSVWSKVIAAGITAVLAALGALAMKHMEGVLRMSAALLTGSVLVPTWLVLGTGIVLAILITAVTVLWRRSRWHVHEAAETEPNAVLVALVPRGSGPNSRP